MQAEVDIVVVSWNSEASLYRCLASIQGGGAGGVRIANFIIVDNASDFAASDLTDLPAIDFPAQVVTKTTNAGFAAACNEGAKLGHAEYILFLNPDVEISPGALAASVQRLQADEAGTIGVVGVGLTDRSGRRYRSCARFPTPGRMLGHALGLDMIVPWLVKPHFLSRSEHLSTRTVDQVMGAFWLMRRRDLERVGGWDARFFLYMEDVDLALRLRGQGQTSLYLHEITVFHEGGGSTGQIKDVRLYYLLRSRIIYARKHFGPVGRLTAQVAMLAVEPMVRLVRALALGRLSEAGECLRVTRWLWLTFPFEWREHAGEPRWTAKCLPQRREN
jgi:N-acetylglucosaminyl-diphospho-decaprenol L-rhamnosyltransferase